jgi:hypothetical protein
MTFVGPWPVTSRSNNCFLNSIMVMHPHTKYHWPISKDKNVMARTRKYYLKKHYLTLRSKVKVPRRSLWYATHCPMVMHPHAKYHWSISVFRDRSMIFGMWVHDHKAVCHIPQWPSWGLDLWPQGQIIVFWIVFSCPGHNIFVFRDKSVIFGMWVHDHKAVCRVLQWPSCDIDLWP